MESSSTHFEVLGLGLEAYKSSKIAQSSAKDYFLNHKNFVGKRQKPCGKFAKIFFLEIARKKFLMTFFFGEHLGLYSWSLASSSPVFGLGFGFCFVSLASSLVSLCPPLLVTITLPEERQNQVYH